MSTAPHLLKLLAVDDEPIGLDILRAHVARVPYVELVGAFTSASDALRCLHTVPVDLLLLDIQMPDVSGLDLARTVGPAVQVIFTTAYPEYAVQGFDLDATDYLLKPISLSRFMQACARARSRQVSLAPAAGPSLSLGSALGPPYLFVKTGHEWVRVNVAELLFVEADDNYLMFHESERRILTRMRLAEALAKLPAGNFQQVHKSYVVALHKLDRVERHQVVIAGRPIPLSSTFRPLLLHRLEST